MDFHTADLNRQLDEFLNSDLTELPGFIKRLPKVSGDCEEILTTTVLDPDEFDRLLRDVSGDEPQDYQPEPPLFKREDSWELTERQRRESFLSIEEILIDSESPHQGCTSPELETSNPEKFEEVSKGFQLDLSKEQNDYYSQAFASMEEPGFDPNESPIDDLINRFRYSRRDFAVLHCEAPPGEVCFETSVQAVTFESPLTPWRCVLHRETIPEDGDKGLNASQRVPDSFTPGSDSLEEIVWKPAIVETPPETAPKAPSRGTSIWKDRDPKTHMPKQKPSYANNPPEESAQREGSPGSTGAQSADSANDTFGTPGCIQVTVINPNISIPLAILNRDSEGFIYVYTTTNPPTAAANHWQYFKIGRPMDIKRQNMRLLQRCAVVRQVRERFPGADFRHLRRIRVSRPNLLMFLVNHELSNNFFNTVPPPMDYCNWCEGPHRDWHYLTAKGISLLEKKHGISLASSLPGWLFINTMINQLIDFIDRTDFS